MLLVIDEVEFTDRIQPVCVPYDTAVDDYDDGTVVNKKCFDFVGRTIF